MSLLNELAQLEVVVPEDATAVERALLQIDNWLTNLVSVQRRLQPELLGVEGHLAIELHVLFCDQGCSKDATQWVHIEPNHRRPFELEAGQMLDANSDNLKAAVESARAVRRILNIHHAAEQHDAR